MSSIHPNSLEPDSPQTEKSKQKTFWQTYNKWILVLCALVLIIISIIAAVFLLTTNDRSENVRNTTKTEYEDDLMNTTDPYTNTALSTETEVLEMEVKERRNYYHRLPRNVIPTKYSLLFRSNIPNKGIKLKKGKEHTFEGIVDIQLDVREITAEIQLHAVNINIHEVKIMSSGVQTNVMSVNRSEIYHDRIVVKLASSIKKGSQTTLHLTYSGSIGRTTEGYFYGNLENRDNVLYTATMNEPAGARLMVPCFDEPSLKAAWVVTMEYPQGYIALANQKQVNITKLSDGFEKATFLPTPPMSSYLLALSVNQHMRICKTAIHKVQICLYTVYGNITKGNEIVDVAVRTLNFLEDFTAISYSLEKLDILVSEVYFAGALECWGLISLQHSTTDPSTIAHEIAHQWFGNMATIDSWGDIWLNEGITYYMQCLITEKLGLDTNCFVDAKEYYTSCEKMLHPIVFEYDNDSPVAIRGREHGNAFFDSVVYQKAGGMMKLFADTYTEKWTKDVLREYLFKFKYMNAITEDFLDIVESMPSNATYEVTPVDFLKDWLYQTGLPVLLVFRLNDTHISVDQTSLVGELKRNAWNVPVFYQIDEAFEMGWLHTDGPLEIALPVNCTITFDPKSEAPYHVLFDVHVQITHNKFFEPTICNCIAKTPANQYYCNRILSFEESMDSVREDEESNRTETLIPSVS